MVQMASAAWKVPHNYGSHDLKGKRHRAFHFKIHSCVSGSLLKFGMGTPPCCPQTILSMPVPPGSHCPPPSKTHTSPSAGATLFTQVVHLRGNITSAGSCSLGNQVLTALLPARL